MRRSGQYARSRPIASPRWSVPRDNQHGPRRASEHTLSDRTFPEALPAAPAVGSKDNQISFSRIGMQHDRASGITVLFDGPHHDAVALRTLPQARQKFQTFALVPRKWIVRGHRVKDVEPGFARTSNAERPIKGITARPREIDRAQNLLNRCHIDTSSSIDTRRVDVRQRQARCTPWRQPFLSALTCVRRLQSLTNSRAS